MPDADPSVRVSWYVWLAGLLRFGGLGPKGEAIAAAYLQSHGCRILYRSYRCPIGEIDLVALSRTHLLFVEVRTRADDTHGEAWETIGPKKQQKVSSLASYFLKHESAGGDRPARFDVVSVTWNGSFAVRPTLRHFPDAFPLRGPWLT